MTHAAKTLFCAGTLNAQPANRPHRKSSIICGYPPPPAGGIVLVSISNCPTQQFNMKPHKHTKNSKQITKNRIKKTKLHLNFLYLLNMMHSKFVAHTHTHAGRFFTHHMQSEISLVHLRKSAIGT